MLVLENMNKLILIRKEILAACFFVLAVSSFGEEVKLKSDDLFRVDHLMEIDVKMLPSDWEKLRKESDRSNASMSRIFGSGASSGNRFNLYKAEISIDGTIIKNIGIRTKGFIGSLNPERPSLKVKFDEYVDQSPIQGLDRLTLNNNVQDVSLASQFLTYKLFNKAGVPAPRVSHCKVTVNGEYLGIYSHVESVRAPFIKKRYQKYSGELYEGTISDFYPIAVENIEAKNSYTKKNRTLSKKLAEVLETKEGFNLDEVKKYINLEKFVRFWAMESLLGFWDGYSANNNNYFIYLNSDTDKFHFLPWGADCMFEKVNKLDPDPRAPVSVKTKGLVAHKLYQLAEGRRRYAKTLSMLLAECWREQELLNQIDRIESRLQPHLTRSQKRSIRSLERTRGFVRQRRRDLLAEMAEGMPLWAKRPEPPFVIGGNRPGQKRDESVWGAARRGELETVRKHLSSGGDVNARNEQGDTLLAAAALVGEDTLVDYLIGEGADANALNNKRDSPLHLAALLGQVEVAKLLVAAGADLNAPNGEGRTPLDNAFVPWNPEIQGLVQFISGILQLPFDFEEVKNGRAQVTNFLRERNAAHGTGLAIEMAKRTARWVTRGDNAALSQYLDDGGDANTRDDKQMTLLNLAALSGQTEIAKMLIARGADVHATNGDQTTPLHSAAFTGRLDLTKLLLAQGARLDMTNDKGQTPLDNAAASWSQELEEFMGFINTLLQIELDLDAIEKGRPQVADLLRSRGAPTGKEVAALKAPLRAAVLTGNLSALREQLVAGADANTMGEHGLTLLSLAALAGQHDAAALLIEHGADLNKLNRDSTSSLHTAAFLGRGKIVQLLLAKGADYQLKNGVGQTPRELASLPWTRELAGILPFLQDLFKVQLDATRVAAGRPHVVDVLTKHHAANDKGCK